MGTLFVQRLKRTNEEFFVFHRILSQRSQASCDIILLLQRGKDRKLFKVKEDIEKCCSNGENGDNEQPTSSASYKTNTLGKE